MPDTQQPISVKEFSSKVKAKYPEYKDVDDNVLAKRIVEKYPEYKGKVLFEEPVKPVTKGEAKPTKQVETTDAPKGGVFKSMFGEIKQEKAVSESTSAPRIDRDQKELTKVINSIPALKKQKIQDITLDRLAKMGKPPLVGSNSYNEEQLKVATEVKPEEYLPSYFLQPSKLDVKKQAIDKFSKLNDEGATDIENKLASGDYVYEDGSIKKKGDFGDMMAQSIVNFVDDISFALKTYGSKSDGEMIYHIKEHNKEKENKIEFGATDFQGKAGEMIGGILPYMVGDGAMSLVNLSAEAAGKLVSKKFTSELFEKYALEQAAKNITESTVGKTSGALMEFGKVIARPDVPIMGFSNMGSNMSAIAADENLTPEQKVNAIKGSGADFFMTGAAQGVLFNSIPDIARKTTAQDLLQRYYPTSDLRYKFTQRLIGGYKDILKATPKDVAIAASIGGGTEVVNSMTKAREGVKVDLSAVPEGALSIATLELIMKAPKVLAHGYNTIKTARSSNYDKINPGWFNQYNAKVQDALNDIVSAPEALYQQSLAVLSKSDSPSIIEAKAQIEQFRKHYNSLPSELTPTEKNKALHIIQLKNEAATDMESASDNSIKTYYENRIKAYDALLGNLVDNPTEFKTDNPLLKKRLDEQPTDAVENKDNWKIKEDLGDGRVIVIKENGSEITINKSELETKDTDIDKQVEKLRADEKAEYDAMTDPTDEVKKKEIFDKYDKLITPLLKEKKAENKPADEFKPTEENIQANLEATPEQRIEAEKQARLAQEQELKTKQDDTTGSTGENKGLATEVPTNVLRDLGESSRELTGDESGAIKTKIEELGGENAARKLYETEGLREFGEPYEVFILRKLC